MPIIKSAKKRVKVAAKARLRNLHTKRQVREALKAFAAALEGGKPAEVNRAHRTYMSAIDTAAKKDVIHKNKAARIKARTAKRLKEAGIKPAKATAEKPSSAKVTKSKPVAKKAAPKKSTTAKKAKKTGGK